MIGIPFASYPQSPFRPCPECGVAVELVETAAHACDGERVLDVRVLQLRDEIAEFDSQLAAWLASPQGRFAVWLAERTR